jgi:hypothetical protein
LAPDNDEIEKLRAEVAKLLNAAVPTTRLGMTATEFERLSDDLKGQRLSVD